MILEFAGVGHTAADGGYRSRVRVCVRLRSASSRGVLSVSRRRCQRLLVLFVFILLLPLELLS